MTFESFSFPRNKKSTACPHRVTVDVIKRSLKEQNFFVMLFEPIKKSFYKNQK